MNKDEWRQVDYLLSVTYPFFKFTSSHSATTNITVHNVFGLEKGDEVRARSCME
jgi:hypothetical protein